MGLLARPRCHVPHNLVDLVVLQLIKNAIRCDHNVVQIVDTALFVSGLRFASDNASHAAKMRELGLAIAERPAHGETAREDSIWTNERVFLFVAIFFIWQRLLPDLLRSGCRHAVLHDCLSLVDIAACLHDSIELTLVRWLMVPR